MESDSDRGEVEPYYEVDSIVDMKFMKGKKHYLVRWVGWGSQTTWEPIENLSNVRDMVLDFEGRLMRANNHTQPTKTAYPKPARIKKAPHAPLMARDT